MAGVKIRKGDKIKALVHHNGVRSGTQGTVTAVYTGTYYAVSYPGVQGVCYTPDPHAEPTGQSGEAPTSHPPNPGPALSAAQEHLGRVGVWERIMTTLRAEA
jgi:hypothetical protein